MVFAEEHEMTDSPSKARETWSSEADREPAREAAPHASEILQKQHELHWGLPRLPEVILFYTLAALSWIFLIVSAALGSFDHTRARPYIATITLAFVFHWAAWFQTAFAMIQRASWRLDETVEERVPYLFFAVRLQRLMIPTAVIAFCTFIQAYARRHDLHDLAYWLTFLLIFIIDTVFSVMNAYNNIVWEADRLWFEDGVEGVPKVYLAILGI